MNLLYFASTDFFRKPNPSFHLMKSMIEDLLAANITIYYIGVAESYAEKHIPEEFEKNKNFHYHLVQRKSVSKSNFVLRYLRGVEYAWKSRRHVKEYMKNSDIVFLQSSPTIIYNAWVARRYAKHQKIIMNIQDMFPGSSIASGVMKNVILQKISYFIQRYGYKTPDCFIAISYDMKNKLIEQGVPEEKVRVVYNWFDDKTVEEVPWESNRFVKKYNLDRSLFYVQYAGTFGYVFDYETVVNVAEKLKGFPDIVFQMIGEGSQKDSFIRLAKERSLDNIVFLPLEPQEMVSDVYSTCNVCFIPLKKGVIGNSVPSKAGLLMACKRPIVTSVDKDSEYFKEVNDNDFGFACAIGDSQSISDRLLELYNNRLLAVKKGQNGFRYGHTLYSRTNNMNKFINILKDLCENS